jgi:hypothetical protein
LSVNKEQAQKVYFVSSPHDKQMMAQLKRMKRKQPLISKAMSPCKIGLISLLFFFFAFYVGSGKSQIEVIERTR